MRYNLKLHMYALFYYVLYGMKEAHHRWTHARLWEGTPMSKRRLQTRNKQVKAVVSELISDALEDAVKHKRLKRTEVNYWYLSLSKAGLDDLGYEPTWGKPWWKPSDPPAPKVLKAAILRRLKLDQQPTQRRVTPRTSTLRQKLSTHRKT